MIGKVSSQLLCFLVIKILLFSSGSADEPRLLLFQPSDTYTLSFAIVSPIELYRGGNQSVHRTSMNTGFAVSYALPYTVKQIHTPTYWSARSFMDELTKNAVYVDTEKEAREEAKKTKKLSKKKTKKVHKKIKRDITAGEFYNVVKESFELSGFDEQCVLKSICELAKVPFHQEEEDDEENLLHELFHLVLTPSIHQAFDDELETEEKRIYEEAEMIGKTSGLCDQAYPKCHVTPLHKHSEYFSLKNS